MQRQDLSKPLLFIFLLLYSGIFSLGSATAATAAVIASAHLTATAVIAAIAVTEEENKDDEKTPVVIASATHESDLRFRLSSFSTAYIHILCQSAKMCYRKSDYLFLLSFNAISSLSVMRSNSSAITIVIAKQAAENRNGLLFIPKLLRTLIGIRWRIYTLNT